MMHDLEDFMFPIDKPEVKQLRKAGYTVIDEVLRYGIYIMDLMVNEDWSKKEIADKVMVSFLRESLEILDGIGVLLKNSCVVASIPLIRKLFECYVQIKYFTDDSTDEKAIAYEVFHIHEQIAVLHSLVKLGKREEDVSLEKIKKLEVLLQQPGWKEANEKRVSLLPNQKSRRYPQWYTLIDDKCWGITSLIRKVTPGKVNKDIYSHLSRSSHGNGVLDHCLQINSDKVVIENFRVPANFKNCIGYPVELAIMIYSCIIKNYLKNDDFENLNRWIDSTIIIKKNELAVHQDKVNLLL